MLHYLPGCDVRNNHPKAIEKLTEYMKRQGAFVDKCCRTSEKLLGGGDMIVQNCTLCELLLKETHPDNPCLSTYEYVLRDGTFPWVSHRNEMITLQDCLRTKDNLAMQKAVRECLRKMDFIVVELEENYDRTRFDGMWIYGKPMQNCIDTAPAVMKYIMDNYTEILPEEEKIRRMKEWVKQYRTDRVIVYCNGCEKGIKAGGGKPVHIVELLAEGL